MNELPPDNESPFVESPFFERNSQLSAMFDNELPNTECELLARRLSRDDALQRQWASYALIGAALRGEPVRARTLASVVRDGKGQVAERVGLALNESVVQHRGDRSIDDKHLHRHRTEWLRPLAGAAIAAGVAAMSIFWLRQQAVTATPAAATLARANTTIVLPGLLAGGGAGDTANANMVIVRRSTEPESYTVPASRSAGGSIASAQLANYVVAHSEFSGPLARRNVLAALVASESVPSAPPGVSPSAPPGVGEVADKAAGAQPLRSVPAPAQR